MAASEESRITSIEELNAKVDKLFDAISKGGPAKETKADAPAAPAGSLDEQIAAAVAKATAADKEKTAADQEKAALHDRVKKLEERTERKPVSISRLTKVFWGGADE